NEKSFLSSSSRYSQLVAQDLIMNIFKNGKIGAFRHLKNSLELNEFEHMVETEHAYLNFINKKGGFNEFKWFESNIKHEITLKNNNNENVGLKTIENKKTLCHVYYVCLNERD